MKQIGKYNNRNSNLDEIENKFKKKDKEMIEEFLVFCGGSAGKTTLKKYRRLMIKICDTLEGDLDKIDLNKLRKFLELLNHSDLLKPTKNEIKKVLKRFLKENYEDWSVRFKQLKDIKTESEAKGNQEKINASTILSKQEIENLIRSTDSLKYRALLILFYESAGRPEEILKLQWRDLNLERGEVKLSSSKTKDLRINPIQESLIHLKRYKQEYPFSNVSPDDWVFPSPQDRTQKQSLPALGMYLKRLGKRVLGKDVFPYLIRHTRASELHKILPPKVYEKFMGHSLDVATRYSHLDKDDVRDVMFRDVYSVKELDEEKKHELEKEVAKLREGMKNMWESMNAIARGEIDTLELQNQGRVKITPF